MHGLPRPLHWANTFLGRGMCLSFDLVFLHKKAINQKADRLVDNRGGYCVGVIICFFVFGGTDSGAWMCGRGRAVICVRHVAVLAVVYLS
ncbi:hypothetical protein EMIT0P294_140068 [Pseudomonas sp. IT-P294]